MSNKVAQASWVKKIRLEPNLFILTPKKMKNEVIDLDWDFTGKVLYGPAISKRFGLSLGINLFPNERVCLFDCIYCCANSTDTTNVAVNIKNTEILEKLTDELNLILSNERLIMNLESIAFCGNGDSLMSPHFSAAVDILNEWIEKVKDLFNKRVKTGVISNFIWSDKNIEALKKLDEIYVKLDAVDNEIVFLINRPKNPYFKIDKYIKEIDVVAKMLGNKIKISTALVYKNERINNYLHLKSKYSATIKHISVKDVYLHNVNPPTPVPIKRATLSEMIEIAKVIKKNSKNVFILWETATQADAKNKNIA